MIIKKILLIFAGLLFILGALELFLCVNPYFGYRCERFKADQGSPDMILQDYLRPCSFLGYELIPNSRDYINSKGLIGRRYETDKGSNVCRIFLLGDSVAAQNGYLNTFLEASMNKKVNPVYIEVYNGAVPSYDVRKYALQLENRVLQYSPDIVALVLFMNDFYLNTCIYYKYAGQTVEYNFPTQEVCSVFTPSRFFMTHSNLYRFFVLRLNNYLYSKLNTVGRTGIEYNGLYYLNKIKKTCMENDIILCAAISPYLKPFDEYDSDERIDYLTIRKVLNELDISYLDLYDTYKELIEKGFPLRRTGEKEDDIHMSAETYKVVAEKISSYILENFLEKDNSE